MGVTELASLRPARLPELAREFLRATRVWAMYPASHPATSAPVDRLHALVSELTADGRMRIGVTPHTLIVDGEEPDPPEGHVREAAAMLHDRDVLQLTFETRVSKAELRALLALFKMDVDTLRARGGPARLWREVDSPTIKLEQVDYRKVMERSGAGYGAVTRDGRWNTIVRCMLDKRSLDEDSQQHLLAISHDTDALEALVSDIREPICAADGSPIVTAQAVAVLNAYQQIAEVVSVRAPDAAQATMRTLASVSGRLTSSMAAEMLRLEDDLQAVDGHDGRGRLVAAMAETTLGAIIADEATRRCGTSDRLARLLRVLDNQGERKHSVLAEARATLSRRLQAEPEKLQELWSSVEQLADASNQTHYTPAAYGAQLGRASERANTMSVADIPEERDGWLASVRADALRRLSVTLLTDLLRLDPTDAQSDSVINELGEIANAFLMDCDHEAVLEIVQILTATRDEGGRGHLAAAGTLQRLATGAALHEAAGFLDAMDDVAYDRFRRTCLALGPATVEAFRHSLTLAQPVSARLVEILGGLGDAAISRLTPLAHDPDPGTRARLAKLLGQLRSAESVALLDTLLRSSSWSVSREALRSLLSTGDTQSTRAIFDFLRTSDLARREEIVTVLTDCRAANSAPLLTQILSESEPFGADHQLVLDILVSLRQLGDPRAAAGVARILELRHWWRPRKTRALRRQAIETLLALPGWSGRHVVTDVARTGDWPLRRLARRALRSPGPGGCVVEEQSS